LSEASFLKERLRLQKSLRLRSSAEPEASFLKLV
jgi:hypothetical protein